jgi:hypothetical protein
MFNEMEGALRNTDENMMASVQKANSVNQPSNQTKAFFDKMKGGFRM